MKKLNFLSVLLFTLAILSSGIVRAQILLPLAVSSGYTHSTNVYEDCSTNDGRIECDFSMNLADFYGAGDYRIQIRLYKGDWNYGFASTIVNETMVATLNSAPVTIGFTGGSPHITINYSTADFFGSAPTFSVSRNGIYRATSTMQYLVSPGVWSDVYTTQLSHAYGALDVPPFTPFGDGAEVAEMEYLNIGSGFTFAVNSVHQGSVTPSFITCPSAPLILNEVENWFGNPGTATLTIEKGYLIGPIFTPTAAPVSTTFWTTGADRDLTSLFSLSGYSGALHIIYQLPDDNCYSTLTPVVETMTISVSTASFAGNYNAYVGLAGGSCSLTTNSKAAATTPTITMAMPTSTVPSTFKCQIANAIGWEGASNVGITDFSFTNAYTVDVYEVDIAGNRGGSPSVYLFSGIGSATGDIKFNDGESAKFDASYPPYFVDPIYPADPTGLASWGQYFYDYYVSAAGAGTLTAMSAKIFCVDVSQIPSSGCTVNKKSYFRIANNGILAGRNGRMDISGIDASAEAVSLEVYPNPTKGELMIPVTEDDTNVSMIIVDNLGKQVMSISNVKATGGTINIENLTAGLYFYTINKENTVYRGKIVKQ